MPGTVSGPRHPRDGCPMLWAVHVGRVSFDIGGDRAEIQRPPAATPGTRVVARSGPSTFAAARLQPGRRARMSDHSPGVFVVLDHFDNGGLLDSEQTTP